MTNNNQKIAVDVLFYIDDNGNKIYDYEEMLREFELKMSELDTEQYSKTSR
jgi:hypothetical protein